ncbi:MAG: undecaprenyl-diphosphatase UppP [Kofleriaceae bacterium]|nr:undecaprenyl-diphosphatase UppP [Kofleriaceae bacterium]
MALWFAAVLGLIQGLSEFIPVSSTAHLRIAPELFGQVDPGAAYTAVIQLGTLLALLVYFAKDLFGLARGSLTHPKGPEARQVLLLALATLPIVVAGLTCKHYIEGPLRSLYVIAATLIVVGIAMWLIDRWSWQRAANGTLLRTIAMLRPSDALIIGVAQAMALVPGVSRSGATICMALIIGMQRREAARFSFLLSIPAIGGAGLLELKPALKALGPNLGAAMPALLVGTLVAAVSGYIVIAWLLRWLSSHRLTSFAVYRLFAGVALLVALALGWVQAMEPPTPSAVAVPTSVPAASR